MFDKKELLHGRRTVALLIFFSILTFSCKKTLLDENPLATASQDQILYSKAGFQNYITALHVAARNEYFAADGIDNAFSMQIGTDVATTGDPTLVQFRDYNTNLTPTNVAANFYWNWAYTQMLVRANAIIVYAQKSDPSIWTNEAERNAVMGEAKFFRAYTYNALANLFGGVPIVDKIYNSPKVDFVRSTRQQVLEFARRDLLYASQWLPATVPKAQEGHIIKAAADHLLSEVYISLKDYDSAIASATAVVNSGLFRLMTTRFGTQANIPGDPYSDLFLDGNQNRSSGNLESIYVIQIEDVTPGGASGAAGNTWLRAWGPRYWSITDPAGKSGMIVSDSMGRGVGWIRPNSYLLYDVWIIDFNNDIRNSPFNIRRQFVYNNPASAYFGKIVEAKTADLDTMVYIFPTLRKIEGKLGRTSANTTGRTFKDVMVFRLAETYLLRAEAYLMKGDKVNAAANINVVRSRAKASLVDPTNVDIDYILDERARELYVEEPRRRTLIRLGKLIERVKKYNLRAETRNSIQEKHQWFPIPQSAIDANYGARLEQNTGY